MKKKAAVAKRPERKPVSLLGQARAAGASVSRSGGAPVEVGDLAPRETWESRKLKVGDTNQYTIILDGRYDALLAITPVRGTLYTEFPGFVVDAAELAPRRGGLGRLTISLTTWKWFDGIFAPEKKREVWEIDMAQMERPILTHPKLNDGEGNVMAVHLGKWLAGNPRDDVFFSYADATGTATLTEDEQEWALKIIRGVETYLAFYPVVTCTGYYDGRPTGTRCGIIETPEESEQGYEYLKTADKIVRNDDKTWTRTRQWTGADKWDADIYTEAT